MGKPKQRKCVYCGKISDYTTDHVIPITLFEKPYPPNLITVPACANCNNVVKAADDTYLRDMIVCDMFGNAHPNAEQGMERLLRADRQGQSDIARTVRERSRFKPFNTKGGMFLGNYPEIPIDTERASRIFERIARGLYYNARKERIPDNYEITVRRYYPWDFDAIFEYFQQRQPNSRVLGNVFGCWFLSAIEDPFSTLWLMLFWERILFSVSVINPELAGH